MRGGGGSLARVAAALLLFCVWASPASACSVADLDQDVARATQDYRDWDWASLEADYAEVKDDIACLDDLVRPGPASRLHLLGALYAASKGDLEGAERALRGVLAQDPQFALSDELAPQGSVLRRALDEARSAPAADPVYAHGAALFVDGSPSDRLPPEQWAVVQLRDPTGALKSWWLTGQEVPADLVAALAPPVAETPVETPPVEEVPVETPPVAEVVPVEVPPVSDTPPVERVQPPPERRWRPMKVGVTAGLTSAGLLGIGALTYNRYTRDYLTLYDSTENMLRILNHTSVLAGAASGALAVGCLVVGVKGAF